MKTILRPEPPFDINLNPEEAVRTTTLLSDSLKLPLGYLDVGLSACTHTHHHTHTHGTIQHTSGLPERVPAAQKPNL